MLHALLAFQLALSHPYVVDGDTIHDGQTKYRLVGIDAPETRDPACALEKQRGDAATARVRELVAAARRVEALPADIKQGRRKWPVDQYGRRLVRIEIDGRDLGNLLIAEGLADVWRPGKSRDWCRQG